MKERAVSSKIKKILMVIVAVILVFVASLYVFHSIKSNLEVKEYPPIGKYVDLETHKLHYIDQGEGDVTIVMDAGLPGTCLDWSWVQDDLAGFARVITYDRAGYGWSELGPKPRTSMQIVQELRELLQKEKIEKPYILVGHSYGGLNMLLYTYMYPDEVAGLVLIDATHPDYHEYLPEEFKDIENSKLAQLKLGADLSPFGVQRLLNISLSPYKLPKDIEDAGRAMGFRNAAFSAAYDEFLAVDESLAQVKEVTDLGDIPLLVITKGLQTPKINGFTDEMMTEYENGLSELQKKFLNLSTNSSQVIAVDSGHFIHYDNPEIIIQEIRKMITQIDK